MVLVVCKTPHQQCQRRGGERVFVRQKELWTQWQRWSDLLSSLLFHKQNVPVSSGSIRSSSLQSAKRRSLHGTVQKRNEWDGRTATPYVASGETINHSVEFIPKNCLVSMLDPIWYRYDRLFKNYQMSDSIFLSTCFLSISPGLFWN